MQDHNFENLFLISVTASMISAGKGSSSSPNSARTACQSGSHGFRQIRLVHQSLDALSVAGGNGADQWFG